MKNNMKKIIYILTVALLPLATFAQTVVITNPISSAGDNFIAILASLLRNVVMPIAAVLVVLFIIYAGFTFLTAQGNPKKIEDAKQRILWALIGAGILLGAEAISFVVCNTVADITDMRNFCPTN